MVGCLASIRAALVVERGCVGEVKIREGRERRGMGIVQRDLMGMVVVVSGDRGEREMGVEDQVK